MTMPAQKGDKLIGDLFKDMQPSTGLVFKASLYSPVDALIRQEILLGYKWQVFVKQLAEGTVNPGISTVNLVAPRTALESYTSQQDSDTGKKFQWDAPDLSARAYKVTFPKRTTLWAAGTKLTFQFSGPANDAVAYLYKSAGGGGWVYQTRITSTYEVAGADQLAKDGATFFILVANGHAQRPFTGTTPITLEVHVDVKTDPKPTGGYPTGLGSAHVGIDLGPGIVTQSCFSNPQPINWHFRSTDYPGALVTWSGRTFKLDATKQAGTTTETLKFNGQVDATGANIITWSVDYILAWIGPNSRADTHTEYTLRDIPLYGALDPSIPFGWQYELKNTPMSAHVTGLKYSDTVTVQGGQPKGCTVTAVDQASTAWEAYADFSTIVP